MPGRGGRSRATCRASSGRPRSRTCAFFVRAAMPTSMPWPAEVLGASPMSARSARGARSVSSATADRLPTIASVVAVDGERSCLLLRFACTPGCRRRWCGPPRCSAAVRRARGVRRAPGRPPDDRADRDRRVALVAGRLERRPRRGRRCRCGGPPAGRARRGSGGHAERAVSRGRTRAGLRVDRRSWP